MGKLIRISNSTNKISNAKTWLLFSEFAYKYGQINEDEYNKIQSKYAKENKELALKIKRFFGNYFQNFERMQN